MSDDQPIGPYLDNLGVETNLRENEMLTDALVLGKVVDLKTDARGSARLIMCSGDGTDWITKVGLIHGAVNVMASGIESYDLDD